MNSKPSTDSSPLDPLAVRERISHRARNVRIVVRHDGDVWLVIPSGVSRAAAWAFFAQHEAWVQRKLAELRARPARAPVKHLRWDGTDRIPLRGQARPLRVVAARLRHPTVRVADDVTVLAPPRLLADHAALERALREALKREARSDAARWVAEEAARLGLTPRRLTLRDPRSLWGSCSANGDISLSFRLVMAPPDVFRYVVVHELCHLRWRGHGVRFWSLVARRMPDYESARKWLRRHGESLHAALATPGRSKSA